MASVSVSCKDLDSYGKFLNDKSAEFKNITSKMEEIVNSLEAGWKGADANNFKANATAYLNNLKSVETALAYYGTFIRNKSSNYNNVCSNFYDMLNG